MTPSRRTLRWPYVLTTVVAGIMPLAIFVAVSYLQSLQRAEAFLTDVVEIAAERAEALLAEAELKLTRYLEVTEGETTPQGERLLHQMVYTDPFFREAGIIDDRGRLVFSTAAPIGQPIPIQADKRADPAVRQLQVMGLFKTAVMSEESIVLSLPTGTGGEINLLVDPKILGLFLDDVDLGRDGYLAFIGPRGVLAVIGAAERIVETTEDAALLRVAREFGGAQIVAAVDWSWALSEWYANLRFAVPVAAVCSAILVVIVFRLLNRRMGLDHDLRLGMRRDEFHIEYQPIVDLETGRCVAAEALLRWRHPSHGYIGPGTFIPIAEETNLIEPLTEWLLKRVAREQAGLLHRHPDLRVGVNYPASLLTTRALETIVQSIPAPLSVDRLIFELTERVFVHNKERAREVILGLRDAGYRFALDDFDAGYSGIGHLHRFEFEFVKIDGSFVQAIGVDAVSTAVLDSLIELADKLGAEVVAEGVETELQLQHLKERGVRLVQGWLVATPMAVAEFERFLGRVAPAARPV